MKLATSIFAVALFCVPAAAGAGPRDDLLRLVPDDYTFCVVVQDLRGLASADGKSSYLKGLAESPLLGQYRESPEGRKIQAVVDMIFKGLDVTPQQVRDDILGDAVVFAFRKGPPGHPETEDGLILVHARDEKLLARLVEHINDLQIRGGELKSVEPVDGATGRYFRRVKTGEKARPDFYALRDHRLLFSGSDALLTDMLARLDRPAKDEPPIARRMKKLDVNESPFVCLINPRAFDGDLAENTRTAKGSEQRFLKEFETYWKAVNGVALFVHLGPAVELGVSLEVRRDEWPAAARRFFAEAGTKSPLWSRIPDDALFAFAGRVHVESLAGMFAGFLTEADRTKVQKGVADAARPFLESDDFGPIARGLGPDVGFWVTRPDPADRSWIPQAILAVRTADTPDGRQAEDAALKGLDFLARLACLSNKELRFRTEKQGRVEVRSLGLPPAFPPAFRPAFAAKGGYLLVAGSPQTIARFDPPTGPATRADEVPILRLSVSGWREYLKDHRQGLIEYLAAARKADPSAIRTQIDNLMPVLNGLDRVEIVQRTGPDRLTVLLRVQPSRK